MAATFSGAAAGDSVARYDLSDVFGRIRPQAFAQAFMRWVQAALPSLGGEQVCLDGKTLRGSRVGEKAVQLMSAYAAKARLTLAQRAVAAKRE